MKKNYLFFIKKVILRFSLSSLFSLFARKTPAQLFTQRHDARYALSLSLSLVCLFIYAKRFITCEEYYFVSARLIKRFCVAVFASGGFFSLSSSLLRALFVVLSLLERNGREKSYALFVSSLRNGKRENVLRERNEDRVVLILVSRVTMARVVFYHQAHIAV